MEKGAADERLALFRCISSNREVVTDADLEKNQQDLEAAVAGEQLHGVKTGFGVLLRKTHDGGDELLPVLCGDGQADGRDQTGMS